MANQPIQSPLPQTPLSGCHTQGYSRPAWNTLGPGTRQLGTAHMTLSPWKLFTLANPKPTYPVLLVLSPGNHNKSSCPSVPLLLLLPEQLMHPVWPPVAWDLWVYFHWLSSPNLLVLPHLNNNKTYTLKQGTSCSRDLSASQTGLWFPVPVFACAIPHPRNELTPPYLHLTVLSILRCTLTQMGLNH